MADDNKKQILDEAMDSLAGFISGGLEVVSGAGDEAKALMRTRLERLVERLDLVDGKKLELANAQIDKLRKQNEGLEKRLAELERKLNN